MVYDLGIIKRQKYISEEAKERNAERNQGVAKDNICTLGGGYKNQG